MIVWSRAARDRDAFEISEVAPEVASTLKMTERDAERVVAGLLKELERMPEGRQYFTVEGYAVVPLDEFIAAPKDEKSALDAYPFEL
jgi:hypothetical protein